MNFCLKNNYYIYFGIIEDKKQVQIIAVIYSKRNQEKQLSFTEIVTEDYPFST